jgi:hypothetical protein
VNVANLARRAAHQPAALRVLAAAWRSGLEVLPIERTARFDVRAAFDAGLLPDLVTHERAIVALLERRSAILYGIALRRWWAAIASGSTTAIAGAVDELARRLDNLGPAAAAAIHAELIPLTGRRR